MGEIEQQKRDEERLTSKLKEEVLELSKKHEKHIDKIESLQNIKESLTNELHESERQRDKTIAEAKELNIKYQNSVDNLEQKIKQSNVELWKSEIINSKISHENQDLSTENYQIKKAGDFHESLIRMPEMCNEDIKHSKMQK